VSSHRIDLVQAMGLSRISHWQIGHYLAAQTLR